MNDEALPTYRMVLTNFDTGLSWLEETFGQKSRPTIGWQIDPFGQSQVTASILKAHGHDGLITNRVSKTVKDQMKDQYGYTFEWCGHDIKPEEPTCMVTHYLEHFYVLPVVRMDQAFLTTQT